MKPLKERQKLREERKANPDIYANIPALQAGEPEDQAEQTDETKSTWSPAPVKSTKTNK